MNFTLVERVMGTVKQGRQVFRSLADTEAADNSTTAMDARADGRLWRSDRRSFIGSRMRNPPSDLSAGVYFARKPNLLDISAFAELLYLADSGWLACSTKARPANLPS